MQKIMYVRPHHAYTWGMADDQARQLGLPLNEYVAAALREKIERDTGEDTSVPAHHFPRRRFDSRGQ